MSKELYLLFGAMVGAIAAYITTKITTANHLRIAKINVHKDLNLQEGKIANEQLKEEVNLERDKLGELHKILSDIAYENSMTASYIDADEEIELSQFRKKYRDNCSRLHEALAIADLFYPELSDDVREIYGQTNMFWGGQDNYLKVDKANGDTKIRQFHREKTIKAGGEIGSMVLSLQYRISTIGTNLKEQIWRSCQNNK